MLNRTMRGSFWQSPDAENIGKQAKENGAPDESKATASGSGHPAETAGFNTAGNGAGASATAPSTAPSTELDPEINQLQTELATLKTKLAETHDRMLRVAADADNARKRWDKERDELRKYAIADFARELLPVIDAFDKAMALVEIAPISSETDEGKALASIIEGVQIASKVFNDSVKKHGIERVPGKGQAFNPEYHNAIARAVDPSVSVDMVLEEFVSGYKIGERVLRTAMVKVATKD
jgi:molecular chaperone GrpE